MSSTISPIAPSRSISPGLFAVANVCAAALFCFVAWVSDALVSGEVFPVAALTALVGFAIFGWVTMLVLALVSVPPAVVVALVVARRPMSLAVSAGVGAATWIVFATVSAVIGTPIVAASGFNLPTVLPAAAVTGAFLGFIVGRLSPHAFASTERDGG